MTNIYVYYQNVMGHNVEGKEWVLAEVLKVEFFPGKGIGYWIHWTKLHPHDNCLDRCLFRGNIQSTIPVYYTCPVCRVQTCYDLFTHIRANHSEVDYEDFKAKNQVYSLQLSNALYEKDMYEKSNQN